jgi:predicted small lipoprotein YifL
MSHSRPVTLILGILAAAALVATLAACGSSSAATTPPATTTTAMTHHSSSGTSDATNLRVTLDNLLGEHALLAMNATDAGFSGSKAFPAIAAQLDKNSVALSNAIASVYGKSAGNTFLNGKFMWRAHIGFFVDYTVALAKHDKAGQTKAVNNLVQYTKKFGAFLAGATGLPTAAVQNDLLGHVLELKKQLDLYAAGNYAAATKTFDEAYNHMFMTGDLLAGAIAKQKGLS